MGFYQFLSNQLSRLFPTDDIVQKRYQAFMELLEHDRQAHEVMAEIEEIYYKQVPVDFKVLQGKYNCLSQHVLNIISSLSIVCSQSFPDLQQFYTMIDSFGRHLFYENVPDRTPPFVLSLGDDDSAETELTGGKTSVLSIFGRSSQLVIPKGFSITTRAFNYFLESNHLREQIDSLLADLTIASPESLRITSEKIISMLRQAVIPSEIESNVYEMVEQTWPSRDQGIRVAVRSSAVGEDNTVSFAGQYSSLVNVQLQHILSAWRKVIESKYSPRALNYRIQCGFMDVETPMGVLVLEMIDPVISGVMYTNTPDEFQNDDINIHSIHGLGELLVDGKVVPEIIAVKRREPFQVRRREKGNQTHRSLPSSRGGTRLSAIDADKINKKVLSDDSAVALAEIGMTLERIFDGPQDVEWGIKKDGTIVVLQSRPLQTHVVSEEKVLECTFDDVQDPSIASGGQTACSGVASGMVKHVRDSRDIDRFPTGGILVAHHALSDFTHILGQIGAVVTEEGSIAGHFASVAREFGVPFVAGVENAMEKIPNNTVVTVNAIERKIFKGKVAPLLDNPCAKPLPLSDSPFMRRFSFLMRFVSPLELVDPAANNFTSTGCRSLHDIIRYSHETAIQSMFQIGSNRWFNTRGIKKLDVDIPIKMNVLDVAQDTLSSEPDSKTIKPEHINSLPMTAVLNGLLHPDIEWGSFSHFNWEEHDRLVMNGGIISPDNAMFASHAILASDYVNLNLKFGYHFVIVDALCSDTLPENQIRFRFSGGGANIEKRMLRTRFLGHILSWLDFTVTIKHDLIDGVFVSKDVEKSMEKLDMIGRLLGATRLMDMYLKTDDQVDQCVGQFKKGIYHYSDGLE